MKRRVLYIFISFVFTVSMVIIGVRAPISLSSADEKALISSEAGHVSHEGTGFYSPGGRNIESYQYTHSEGYPSFPDRAKYIGTLAGSWYDMGKQFGERSGELARYVSDIWWKEQCDNWGKAETLKAMELYEAQIFALDPKQIDFMRGIAEGAGPWLNESPYADSNHSLYATNYERVLAVNIYDEWSMRHPCKFPDGASTHGGLRPEPAEICGDNDFTMCSGFSVRGDATLNGEVIAAHNRQSPYDPRCYEEVYIIKPPEGNTAWVLTNCPQVAANQVVNDKGLSIKLYAGGATNKMSLEYDGGPYYAEGFGVSWFNLLLYIGTHADTAEEAIKMLTIGPPEYLAKTGRNSLLRGGGWLFMVTDKDTLAVVETTADRYAVRYAGDEHLFTGPEWRDPNYIVCTNNCLCDFSYDKDNIRTDIPMTIFSDGYSRDSNGKIIGLDDRGVRFWTAMWDMKHNYGRIDKYRMQQILSGLYAYDKDTGKKIECAPDSEGTYRTWGNIKPCHVGVSSATLSGGSNDGKIAILNGKDTAIYWTMGSPTHWEGAWDEFSFIKRAD